MKKMSAIFVTGILLLTAVSLFSNPKLMTRHKSVTDGFKQIKTCNDCHNDVTKLEKKPGQNYKALWKTESCAGKGCHK